MPYSKVFIENKKNESNSKNKEKVKEKKKEFIRIKKSEWEKVVGEIKHKNENYEMKIKELEEENKRLKLENEKLKNFRNKFKKEKILTKEQIELIEILLTLEKESIREIAEITGTSIGTIYRVKNKEIKADDYPSKQEND